MNTQTLSPLYPRLAVASVMAVCLALLWAASPRAEALPKAGAEKSELVSVQDKTIDDDLGLKLLLHRHLAPVVPPTAGAHG